MRAGTPTVTANQLPSVAVETAAPVPIEAPNSPTTAPARPPNPTGDPPAGSARDQLRQRVAREQELRATNDLLRQGAQIFLEGKDMRCLPAMFAAGLNDSPLADQIRNEILLSLGEVQVGFDLRSLGSRSKGNLMHDSGDRLPKFKDAVRARGYARSPDGGPLAQFLVAHHAPQEMLDAAKSGRLIGGGNELFTVFEESGLGAALWNEIRPTEASEVPPVHPHDLLRNAQMLNKKNIPRIDAMYKANRSVPDQLRGFANMENIMMGTMVAMMFIQMVEQSDAPSPGMGHH